MNQAQVLAIARDAVYTMLLVAGPALLTGLAVGLLISLFQALTSLQEATLTFVPKLFAIFMALLFLASYMARHMGAFTHRIMDAIIALP